MSGRFCDGTAVTITAPLGEDDVTDLTSNQVGDQVLSWLTTHAL
ncbi:hypothetical protein [Actinokineospora enzanensis]|nr:hypothetical protein [Actinokineospora enzanensis]